MAVDLSTLLACDWRAWARLGREAALHSAGGGVGRVQRRGGELIEQLLQAVAPGLAQSREVGVVRLEGAVVAGVEARLISIARR